MNTVNEVEEREEKDPDDMSTKVPVEAHDLDGAVVYSGPKSPRQRVIIIQNGVPAPMTMCGAYRQVVLQ